MAPKLPEFLTPKSPAQRLVIILAAIAGLSLLIVFGNKLFMGKGKKVSNSRVASAPASLESVPGGELTPEYSRALLQANSKAAQQAKTSGGSAIPTLINLPNDPSAGTGAGQSNCVSACPGDVADVTDEINNLVRLNKLSQSDANNLLALAKNDVSVGEYGAALDNLVRQGKLSPQDARRLLEIYQRQHAANSMVAGTRLMDSLVKAGKMPIDAEARLLALQKQQVTPAEYEAELNRLVKEGKITPDVANQLLAQYTQQRAKDAANEGVAKLTQMAQSGQIPVDVANTLIALQKRQAPVAEYAAELQRLVAAGKITPAVAAALLADYQKQRGSSPASATLRNLVALAEKQAASDVSRLVKSGKISAETGDKLLELQRNNVTPLEYQKALDDLVKAGKISQEDANRLATEYSRVQQAKADANKDLADMVSAGKMSPEAADKLLELQRQHVSPQAYQEALNALVRSGQISPEEAQQLSESYGKMQKARNELHDNIDNVAKSSGNLPQAAVNELTNLEKRGATAQEYQDALNDLVKNGKLSKANAQELATKYNKVLDAKNGLNNNIDNLAANGKISRETANELADLAQKEVSADEYAKKLDDLVKAGKISREDANKLLDNYKTLQNAKQDLNRGLSSTMAEKKLSADDLASLDDLEKKGVSGKDYQDQLDKLVKEGKLSQADAQELANKYNNIADAKKELNDNIDSLAASGKISRDTASQLSDLAQKDVPVSQYAKKLDDLVKAGKISREDANQLLDNYKALQNAKQGLSSTAAQKKLSQKDIAALSDLAKKGDSEKDYQKQLDKLVKEGKLSPAEAAQLRQNYHAVQEAKKSYNNDLNKMVSQGRLSKEAAKKLSDLANQNVSPEQYRAALSELVNSGQLSDADAKRLMASYEKSHDAEANLNSLVTQGKLSPEEANQLLALQKRNATPQEYQAALDALVQSGKLTPEEAKRLGDDYKKLQDLRNESQKLQSMQANNASVGDYAAELDRAVKAGVLTPEQAAALLQEYKAAMNPVAIPGGAPAAGTTPGVEQNIPTGTPFEQLSARLDSGAMPASQSVTPTPVSAAQFNQEDEKKAELAEEARKARIEELSAAMSGQAQQLIASWQGPSMRHVEGQPDKSAGTGKVMGPNGVLVEKTTKTTTTVVKGPPLIKAGTILFAVLSTAVNSDYPDTPVMATIVSGKLKGAKLLGKLSLATGQDRLSLNFNLMDMNDWISTKGINAFAIDPDTARTVLATDVDHHYLKRYGAMMGSAFVSGYANAINTSGSTSTSSVSGITNTHPPYSAQDKLITGIGQVGTTLGTVVQSYVNTPATVKIDSGVGIGILFMSDVQG